MRVNDDFRALIVLVIELINSDRGPTVNRAQGLVLLHTP